MLTSNIDHNLCVAWQLSFRLLGNETNQFWLQGQLLLLGKIGRSVEMKFEAVDL